MKDLAKEINLIIKNSEEYKAAKEAESLMMNDVQTVELLIKYQSKQKEYNDALRFEAYGSDVSRVQKELADIKYLVDTNVFVMEYNRCYKKVKDILDEATKRILDGIK